MVSCLWRNSWLTHSSAHTHWRTLKELWPPMINSALSFATTQRTAACRFKPVRAIQYRYILNQALLKITTGKPVNGTKEAFNFDCQPACQEIFSPWSINQKLPELLIFHVDQLPWRILSFISLETHIRIQITWQHREFRHSVEQSVQNMSYLKRRKFSRNFEHALCCRFTSISQNERDPATAQNTGGGFQLRAYKCNKTIYTLEIPP